MKKRLPILGLIIIGILIYYVLTTFKTETESDVYYGEAIGVTTHISAEASGIISDIHIKEGDTIATQTPLASLKHSSLEIQLEQATSALVSAQAALDLAKTPYNDEELAILENTVDSYDYNLGVINQAIKKAKTGLSNATATLEQAIYLRDIASEDYDKAMQLYENAVISQQELQGFETLLTTSKTNVVQAQNNLDAIDHEITSLQNQYSLTKLNESTSELSLSNAQNGGDTRNIEIAESNVKQAKFNIDLIKLQMEKYTIINYKSGYVETINYDLGEYITAGASFATIYDPNALHVFLYIKEADLAHIQSGDVVELFHESQQTTITGTINAISSEAMYTPLNIVSSQDYGRLVFEIDILLDENSTIKPGMLLSLDMTKLKEGDQHE